MRAAVLASALPKHFTGGLDRAFFSFILYSFPAYKLVFVLFRSVSEAGTLLSSDSNTEDPARRALALRTHILQFQSAISAIERCRVPVILAAHGSVIGLGVDIACACDIRYASSDAVFAIKVSACQCTQLLRESFVIPFPLCI